MITSSAFQYQFVYYIRLMLVQVSSHDIFGTVFFQSPSLRDFDQRDMFCFYLYPGNDNNTREVCRSQFS